ncbi:hypothetical protein [Sphingomonas sp. LT1P40]|uniref:hypothetical protein n=1 Tax=Alteristakelama amylovorans TaxID=3096166 RepID=UPI002FCACDBD
MAENRIVAVGLLSQRDLDLLGAGFSRHFPVSNDEIFDDLLRQLDQVELEPLGKSVVMRTQAERPKMNVDYKAR